MNTPNTEDIVSTFAFKADKRNAPANRRFAIDPRYISWKWLKYWQMGGR